MISIPPRSLFISFFMFSRLGRTAKNSPKSDFVEIKSRTASFCRMERTWFRVLEGLIWGCERMEERVLEDTSESSLGSAVCMDLEETQSK